ncbi:response regulator [Paenibacillus alba]|uniref:Response regulator n=1 Tax=Paenibacillus alba TaxID=1197127 RepID=A0ABU6G0I9_9BACL|nr:response regulator [Paenibacillus alba]MEC0227678.1 response regulator [Paenibacillus alba]
MSPSRIVLIDDEINIREGLRRIIERSPSFQVMADFPDGGEALEWLERNTTDIVLSDIRMPGIDGIEVCSTITRRWPHIKVILLTGHAEFNYAYSAIKAGVLDYILKPCDPAIIIETLERASEAAATAAASVNSNAEGVAGKSSRSATYDIQSTNPWILTAVQYVEANYEKELSVPDIACQVHLSSSYFSTIFKEETGHSLSHFIHLVRIERSKYLLSDLQYKSYEVAELVGYKTFRHFNEIFKMIVGQTPSEYRRTLGNRVATS